jgi:N-acetylmuramoyl-L-alanine amidase
MNVVDIRHSIRKHPTKPPSMRNRSDITHIAVHHSATKSGTPEAFANYHVGTLGWSRMGYTYVITKDGVVHWCADWEVKTPHVGNSNKWALGICLVGDFRTEEPTKEQWTSLYSLLAYVRKELNIPTKNVWSHQEFPTYSWKPCPSLDMNEIRRKVDKLQTVEITVKEEKDMNLNKGDRSPDVKTLQENLIELGYGTVVGAADGIFGEKTDKTVRLFQKANGLTVDGIAGQNTLNKIKAILKPENRQVKESTEFTLGGRKFRISEV